MRFLLSILLLFTITINFSSANHQGQGHHTAIEVDVTVNPSIHSHNSHSHSRRHQRGDQINLTYAPELQDYYNDPQSTAYNLDTAIGNLFSIEKDPKYQKLLKLSHSAPMDCRLLNTVTSAYDINFLGKLTQKLPQTALTGYLPNSPPRIYQRGKYEVNGMIIDEINEGLVISFRGTMLPVLEIWKTISDWGQDLKTIPRKYNLANNPNIQLDKYHLPANGITMHSGFYESTDSLLSIIIDEINKYKSANPSKQTIITGHSKGGAMAQIAAARLLWEHNIQIDKLVLFASPRAGNSLFVSSFPTNLIPVVRYESDNDIVPLVPPSYNELNHMDGSHQILRRLLLKGQDKSAQFIPLDWDYKPLGQLKFIQSNGEILSEYPTGKGSLKSLSGSIGAMKYHGPWCKSIFWGGLYMKGVCTPDMCM